MAASAVLLIEDDPSIRRFVAMALEDLPLRLVEAPTLAAARAALAEGRPALVITDLMLPDGSAEALLAERPAGDAVPWIVLSAGLTPQRVQRLQAQRIRRLIEKPVPLADLLAAVREALPGDEPAGSPATMAMPVACGDAEDQAIAQQFGGDAALFREFRESCVAQFARDLADGEAACARRDLPALRRLAHNLKSVLGLIGQPALSAQARGIEQRIEQQTGAADADAAFDAWAGLAAALRTLR